MFLIPDSFLLIHDHQVVINPRINKYEIDWRSGMPFFPSGKRETLPSVKTRFIVDGTMDQQNTSQ